MAEDVDLAVKAARRAFEAGTWSRAAPEARKAVLLRLADLVREHKEELAVLESLDSGKTINDCLHEIGNEVPTFFQWYAELIDKSFGKVAPTGEQTLALIVKEPIGVVGLVLPWNFPLLMAAWKLAPALAAGCSCRAQAGRADAAHRAPARRARHRGRRARRACSTSCRASARPPARRSAAIWTSTSSPSPARPRSAPIS